MTRNSHNVAGGIAVSTHYYCYAHDHYDCAKCRKTMLKHARPAVRRANQDDGGMVEAITNKLYDGDYDGEMDYDAQEAALIDFLMRQPMDEDYFGPEDTQDNDPS